RPYAGIEAFNFYMRQAEEYWARLSLCEQAMTAIIMYRYGKTDVAQSILRSLKEKAQLSDETGMYWSSNRRGYFWYESPVEVQTMMIEAFREAGDDSRAVEEMKLWLLRNKQTTDWQTSKATVGAIYALLADEYSLLDGAGLPADIRIGGKPLKKAASEPLNPEAGTGYVSATWHGKEISSAMADLVVVNPNPGVMWGAMYWQYFEEADRVASSAAGLSVDKQLLVRQVTRKGKVLLPVNRPEVGDVVTVRLELRADRDFEYVHLKDMRATAFEPENPVSGYRRQDGLEYYECFKDASVNFFIRYLPKGSYVLEYDLRVCRAGDFSNGIATVQCMYAPEFGAHSRGIRIRCRDGR
ncbi:MAG: hypothetical protein LBR08_07505, partial [Bacteroidales bacterium]|nr:hypothetical protein [Bacteroidales bacterium]